MVITISKGANIFLVTLTACILASLLNLFMINGKNLKTIAAFYSILLVVSILIVFTVPIVYFSHIQGFTTELSDTFMVFETQIQVSYESLAILVVIMSVIGALIDAAISITSSMYEVVVVNPAISNKELYKAGVRMGQDILSTNINTLYFAFLGGNVAFCIWLNVYQYSFGQMINYKIFVEEMLTLIVSGIGCILVIPIAAGIFTRMIKKKGLVH